MATVRVSVAAAIGRLARLVGGLLPSPPSDDPPPPDVDGHRDGSRYERAALAAKMVDPNGHESGH